MFCSHCEKVGDYYHVSSDSFFSAILCLCTDCIVRYKDFTIKMI